MKLCVFFLTCANTKEAEKISQALLDKNLALCIKKMPVSSSFLWQGSKTSAEEVLLMMDSIEENFIKVDKVVKYLHTYKTYVLYSLPITQTTNEVNQWYQEELK